MIKGLQYVLLLSSAVSISLLGGKNIGLTKEIDNRRESVVCTLEKIVENGSGLASEEVGMSLGYTDSFWVEEDETVYLLDTYGKRVLEMFRQDCREILLSASVLPADITTCKENIFIYDDLLSELQIYTKQGEFLSANRIFIEGDYVKQLSCVNEEVLLQTYRNQWYTVNQENGTLTICKEKEVPQLKTGEYNYAEYIDTDEDGTVYSVHTKLVEDCSVISGELTLQAVSATGELLGSYILPVEEYVYLPDRYIQIHQNGNIYCMIPTVTSVEVRKIALKDAMESKLQEIWKTAEALEMKYNENAKSKKNYAEEILYTREEVRQRCCDMAEYEWILKKTNTSTGKSEPGVVLPREIEAIRVKHEGESSWSDKVIGIPYCWGGFYSLDVGFKGKNFQDVISGKYVAGNINPKDNYKYMTAGVDCSGYVCAAFGLTQRTNTSGLAAIGSKQSDITQLEQMDILVAPGDHVIFFFEWIDDATMLVSESAVREGKVTIHPKSVNEFVICGMYQMRSPW